MSETDTYVSPSRVPALVALLLALVGGAGLAWSFVNGISAALSGGESGAAGWVVVFFVSAAVVLAALVTSIVCLVSGKARGIAGFALVLSIVPLILIVLLRLAGN